MHDRSSESCIVVTSQLKRLYLQPQNPPTEEDATSEQQSIAPVLEVLRIMLVAAENSIGALRFYRNVLFCMFIEKIIL